MRSFLWILFVGLISYTKAIGWHVPTHVFDPLAERDPHGINKALEDKMSDLWDQHTIVDAETVPEFVVGINGTNHTIIGKTMKTNLMQRLIFAYQGFRYGKEPNRETKFKKPEPEDYPHWEGTTFNADHLGFKCPQNSMVGSTISGQKDCLYLNVYTPYVPNSQDMIDKGPLPVMFFIHGGAFVMGDASMYLPTKLLEYDVILVTIHYRMGAQGFFTLNNADAPGNTALYDMLEALQWTHDHISDFGGNPNQVTIFGESAGSVAVNYLMLSPAAEGLFHGVIAESGSALDFWAIDEEPSYAAGFITDFLGCSNGTDEEIFQCMLEVSEEDLCRAENKLISTDRHMGYTGFRGAAPTIQLNRLQIGVEPIIAKHPREILYTGEFTPVPFMTGANRDEGSFVVGIMYGDFLVYNHHNEDPEWMREEMVQVILHSIGITDDTRAIEESLTNYYCKTKDVGNLTISSSCIIDMVGALFLKAGSWQTCNIHSYWGGDGSTFHYSFEFPSDDTMYLWLLGETTWDTGITHSDEMMYIFSMPAVMDADNYQQLTEMRMSLMWTNFATYGDPTPDADKTWENEPYNLVKWEPFNLHNPRHMIINTEWTVESEFSDRWAIDAGKDIPVIGTTSTAMPSTAMPTTAMPEGNTTTNVGISTSEPLMYTATEYNELQNELHDVQKERDAYLATMIVFIILFVAAAGGCIFLIMKNR